MAKLYNFFTGERFEPSEFYQNLGRIDLINEVVQFQKDTQGVELDNYMIEKGKAIFSNLLKLSKDQETKEFCESYLKHLDLVGIE